jgi:hypothetical protein
MSPQAGELLLQEIAPRLRNSIAHCVPRVGSDDIAELTQDSIAIAASLLSSAEARGKKVTAGKISYYTTKLIRQGRRSTGQSKTDVMHPSPNLVRSLTERVFVGGVLKLGHRLFVAFIDIFCHHSDSQWIRIQT